MKKFLSSFSFILKASLLVLLLIFGWVFINVANFIKGKKLTEKDSLYKNMFGADDAIADVPGGTGGTGGTGGGGFCCPHVAYFDSNEFRIENDFLCESFKYFPIGFKHLPFKDKFLRQDLLKLTKTPTAKDGNIVLQFQENEEEESFIKWFKLIRVIHSKDSEVLVNSDFNSFEVWNPANIDGNVIMPFLVTVNGVSEVTSRFSSNDYLWENPSPETDTPFERNTILDFNFKGLNSNHLPRIIVKSVLRDWMAGEEEGYLYKMYLPLARSLAILAGAIYFLFEQKSFMGALAFFPVVFGVQAHSIRFSYEDNAGSFRLTTIHKPRAWSYGTEVIDLPNNAVKEDDTLRLRAEFTKRHKLCFVGAVQNIQNMAYRKEELSLSSVISSRFGDITESFSRNKNYNRMVPGDKIDVVFKNPSLMLSADEKETYLLQTFGYYTALSKEGKKLAGNWQEKISEEAKAMLASFKSPNN